MSTQNPPQAPKKYLVFGQRPTSWTKKLKANFSSETVYEGRTYFYSRSVDIRSGSSERIEAFVREDFRSGHTVAICVDGDAVVFSCTCPAFKKAPACGHIWSVILAAERKGHLGRIGEIAEPAIKRDGKPEAETQDRIETISPPRKDPSRPELKPEPWKQHFAVLRSLSGSATTDRAEPDRRLVYLVEIGGSVPENGLALRVAASNRKKNGEWGKPGLYENSIRDTRLLPPSDQTILGLLTGSRDMYGYSASRPQTQYRIPEAAQSFLLPMLCATGRCYLTSSKFDDMDAIPALVWDDGPAFSLLLRVERNEGEAAYKMQAVIQRGGEIIRESPILITTRLLFFRNRVCRFDPGVSSAWLHGLSQTGTVTVPFASRMEFLREIANLSVSPPLELPEELRIETRNLAAPPIIKIKPPENPNQPQAKLRCEVVFNYGGIHVSAGDKTSAVHDPSCDRFFARDRSAESAALAKASEFGLRQILGWQRHRWELAPSRFPSAVRSFVSEGWQVEADGKLYRRAGSIQLEVRSGIDWFELEGQAEFEGEPAKMPELLKAISRGENMIRLDDGSYGVVPEEWLNRYRLLAGVTRAKDGQIRFGKCQAGLLDALLASEPAATFDAGFLRVRQQLSSFQELKPSDPPPTFQGTLRGYQREGLGWLEFLRCFGFGGCLADDMGLGKTIQALAMLDSKERRGPALVVVPRSLVFNWKQEAAKFAPRLRVLDLTGSSRKDQWNEIPHQDLVLSTYGTLRRDAAFLKDLQFDTVILDEAQIIKNPSTEAAKAARLLKADHRLVLTGTPIENRVGDLWSLFEFLNPGMLGGAEIFRGHAGVTDDSVRIFSQALRPFILRRTKEHVARELPGKTEQTIYCELEGNQRRLYNELRDHYRDSLLGRIDQDGIEKSRMHILEALLRLRQAACHPGLIDSNRIAEPSAKIDTLLPQLMEVIDGGHKALVFSQFTSLLGILKPRLDALKINYEYLDGRTRDRQSRVERFQTSADCSLFLISLKAGGLGLNLTAAEYVFLLDPWWNPAVEAQAIDRTHRIGQSRHVFAYRLIVRDTVEEKVIELQKSKREIADAIITASNSVIAGLTREHLELLLS
jgi:superfamily II DNA or RNA helicase